MGRSRRAILAASLLVVSLLVFHREVGFLFKEDPRVVAEVTENFNHGVVQRPDALENHGFVVGSSGWYLAPQSTGRLVYRAPQAVGRESGALLFLFFYRLSPEVRNALKLSWGSEATAVTIAHDVHLVGGRVDLTPYLPSGGVLELAFEATNGTASPVLVLDKMELRVFAGRPSEPPSPPVMTLAFLSLGVAVTLVTKNWLRALAPLLILGVGLFVRLLYFDRVIYRALDPDAQGYRLFAERMTLVGENGFYSANFSMREPFFLLVAKAVFHMLGPSDTHLRLLSLFLSLLVIHLVYKLARALFGYELGLLAGLGMSLNVPLVVESGRGLRLELEMVLLLLFCYVGFVKREIAPLHRFLLLGLLGGATVLTRSSYLLGLFLLAVIAAVVHERSLRRIALMGALAVLLMISLLALHQVMIYKRHGDPFWDTNMHVRFYANQEFGGTPGFPSREVLERDAYAGPKLTYAEYLFRLHTPAEAISGTLRGALKIAAGMDLVGSWRPIPAILGFNPGWVDHVFTAVGGSGLLLALGAPGLRWLPLAFLVLTGPVAFLYDRGLTEPYRLTMQGFPFFLLSALLPVQRVWAWTKAGASKARSAPWAVWGR